MNNIAAKLREVHWRAGWETDDGARVRRQREREEGADEIERLTAEVEKLRAALLVTRKYVLMQSCEFSLQPEDAARDLDVIDEALEKDDD